jgi:predicted  nucleic acid-binding Zn-ribbon protein
MRTVDILHELQAVDSQLDAARIALTGVQSEIGDRSSLTPLTQQVAAAQSELQQLQAEQRDLELDAAGKSSKVTADNTKLYSGRVTNPKELASLAEEVEQERHQLGVVEDRLLEILEATEQLTARLNDLQTALASQTRTWNTGQERARARAVELQESIRLLEDQRESLTTQVSPAVRSSYDHLRRQKGGLALGTVVQRTCQACRVASLTPALEHRARVGDELVNCPSCGRILYISIS